jgi:hypothetical protein
MSSSTTRKGLEVVVPRFRSALKKLASNGVEALKPQQIAGDVISHWKPPVVPNRIASVLRKQAVQDGTYGAFDVETLQGWESSWDVELAKHKSKGQGRIKLRPGNKTSRQRTREKRATKIETSLQEIDQRIEQYYQDKKNAKPSKTFENNYKRQMHVKR